MCYVSRRFPQQRRNVRLDVPHHLNDTGSKRFYQTTRCNIPEDSHHQDVKCCYGIQICLTEEKVINISLKCIYLKLLVTNIPHNELLNISPITERVGEYNVDTERIIGLKKLLIWPEQTEPNLCEIWVLTVVNMSNVVFWVATPCGLVGGYKRFGGTYRLLHQGLNHHNVYI
jgi:hypothetical protein